MQCNVRGKRASDHKKRGEGGRDDDKNGYF